MEENTNNKSNSKVLGFLIGDLDKWKKLPQAFNELGEEMQTKRRWWLIFIFALCLSLTYGSMQGLRWVQNNAQYCEIITKDSYVPQVSNSPWGNIWDEEDMRNSVNKASGEALPIPKSGERWSYYLKYYEEGRKQPWIGFNCSWDFKRFCDEEGIC